MLGVIFLIHWRRILAGTLGLAVLVALFVWYEVDENKRAQAKANAEYRAQVAAKCTTTPERFLAKYRVAYPRETAGQSDDALLRQVLEDYPEWAPKVCRDGVPVMERDTLGNVVPR